MGRKGGSKRGGRSGGGGKGSGRAPVYADTELRQGEKLKKITDGTERQNEWAEKIRNEKLEKLYSHMDSNILRNERDQIKDEQKYIQSFKQRIKDNADDSDFVKRMQDDINRSENEIKKYQKQAEEKAKVGRNPQALKVATHINEWANERGAVDWINHRNDGIKQMFGEFTDWAHYEKKYW